MYDKIIQEHVANMLPPRINCSFLQGASPTLLAGHAGILPSLSITGTMRVSDSMLERRVEIMVRHFTLEYWIDEGWYVGRIKEVPGVFSQGETLDQLEKNIREAYKLMTEEDEPVWTSVQQKEIEVEV